MDIAMTLPTMITHDRSNTLDWCRAVDEGPWSSLAIPERITYPSHSWIVELSAAAALTERVRLWTTIIVLPAHPAVDVAKQLASVDQLCEGRLTVGIGVGGREHDYRAIDAPFGHRWSRMDEQVATMKRIWAGEPPFEGAEHGGTATCAGRRTAPRLRFDGPQIPRPRREMGDRCRRRFHRVRHRSGRDHSGVQSHP
jgi:alkanesulfonate monooxygenase SsuD/methylene tetrahydromethanopterin reductase-like flavin-dependent oxidoreductase (luciferase family)